VIGRTELKDDPRFATRSARVTHMRAVDELLESWTSHHPKDEVAEKMLAASVPCAPVRELSEVIIDRNMHERGSLQWFDHPELGRVVLPHSPLRFEGLPLKALEPSAKLGDDNHRVFGDWLGLDDQERADLARDGVI
jgi:formyl-CoA transferase